MRIAVGASSFQAAGLLEEKGIEISLNPFGRKLTKEETIELISGCDGLLAGLEPLNEETLKDANNLKAIARIGIGMDNVDAEYAKSRGIIVSNTPDAPTEAVAEMCLAALLSISRRIIEANRDVRSGVWKKRLGFSLRGKTVLFVGYGRIARRFRALLEPFECEFLIYDPALPELSIKELPEGLSRADIITLHANAPGEIIGKSNFSYINGAVILNSARGTLINEELLYEGLKSGAVAHYWGDVFADEPYNGRLCELENAVLTPHISTYTDKCRVEMETQAVNNILRDLGYAEKL